MFCVAGTAKDDDGWHCLGRKQVTVRQSLRVKLAQNNECFLYSNDQEIQSDLVTQVGKVALLYQPDPSTSLISFSLRHSPPPA